MYDRRCMADDFDRVLDVESVYICKHIFVKTLRRHYCNVQPETLLQCSARVTSLWTPRNITEAGQIIH